MYFVSFVVTGYLASGNAATGLLRNSNADVATYFCCLDVRIIRRILFRIFATAAYISSHIFVRNIYCAARHKRLLICTVFIGQTLFKRGAKRLFGLSTAHRKKGFYESKQKNPYNETKARK